MSARTTLPVADRAHVLRDVRRLLVQHRRPGLRMLGLHTVAALVGLTGPFLLGRLVDDVVRAVREGTALERVSDRIDTAVAVLVVAVLAQAVLARLARARSLVLAEAVFAQLREEFLTRATAILGGAFIVLSIALAALATVSRAPASIDTRLARDPATTTAPSTTPYDPATQGARPADPLAEVANQAAPVSNSAVPLAQ